MKSRAKQDFLLAVATATLVTAAPQVAYAQNDAEQASSDEIVVTARRREERLIDVPLAVSSMNAEMLERAGVESTLQLAQTTPGLYVSQATIVPQPTIRGIGPRGTSAGDESIVPFYIDGVYQPFMSGLFFDLNNVSRVEVLRGPQGTLYGRNATGGAINIITRTPTTDPTLELGASYGSFNERSVRGYGSVGAGDLAIDLAFLATKDDGYIDDVTRNETIGARDSIAARTRVEWTPSDNLTLGASYSYVNTIDNTGLAPQVINGNTTARFANPAIFIPTDDYEVSLSFEPHNKIVQNAASFSAELDLGVVTLTSITGWQSSTGSTLSDSDATAANSALLRYDQYSESLSEELYLTSTGSGPFSWIAGVFVYHDESGYDPRYNTAGLFFSESVSDAVAVYAEGTLDLNDAWSVTAGARYSYEEKTFEVQQLPGARQSAETDFENVSPTLSVQYTPTEDVNLYVRYGEAFKAGIFNTSTTNRTPVSPEEVSQIEAGLKWQINDSLRFEGAIYDTTYENIQVTARDPLTGTTYLQNAAAASLAGAEAYFAFQPTENANLRVGLTWIDATYNEFQNAQAYVPRTVAGVEVGGNVQVFADLSGNRLYKVPEFSANIGGDYTVPLESGAEFVLGANVSYQGDVFWDASNRLSQDAVTIVNGNITWRSPNERYGVTLWGENLLDETYFLSATSSPSADFGSYARPLSIGVRVNVTLF